MLQTLSTLVYGNPKVGKSMLSATSPGPVLVLDAEGGWKFMRLRMVMWDPRVGPPPQADGTWDACIVMVRDWVTVQQVYAWMLRQDQHQFTSIVLDSVTEIQRRAKASIGEDAFRQADWGTLLTMMDKILRGFRDLCLIPGGTVQAVTFIAEAVQREGIWRPNLQGAIATSLPYFVDLVGFLFAQPGVTAEGNPGAIVRQLLASPHPQYVTGERLQGRLPPVIGEPNISAMLQAIYPTNKETTP